MQCIFRKENVGKARKYRLYRHLTTFEKIIKILMSFYIESIGSGGLELRLGSSPVPPMKEKWLI